jgi:hypothetical protein
MQVLPGKLCIRSTGTTVLVPVQLILISRPSRRGDASRQPSPASTNSCRLILYDAWCLLVKDSGCQYPVLSGTAFVWCLNSTLKLIAILKMKVITRNCERYFEGKKSHSNGLHVLFCVLFKPRKDGLFTSPK